MDAFMSVTCLLLGLACGWFAIDSGDGNLIVGAVCGLLGAGWWGWRAAENVRGW